MNVREPLDTLREAALDVLELHQRRLALLLSGIERPIRAPLAGQAPEHVTQRARIALAGLLPRALGRHLGPTATPRREPTQPRLPRS